MDGETKKLVDYARRFEKAGLNEEWYDCVDWLYKEAKTEALPEVRHFRRIQKMTMKDPRFASTAAALLKKSYILTARDVFEDYIIAMEWNRPAKEQFYLPRQQGLAPVVSALQRLADDELDTLCISMPPGVGKSGTAHFFETWLMGRNPLDAILEGSHSGKVIRADYTELLGMIDPKGDYLWHEIFPERKLVKTDALDLKIHIDKVQKFSSLAFTTTGSENAGAYRAIQLLYVDDLIATDAEALSPERLESKWRAFGIDLMQRMLGEAKMLVIGTRWSCGDPIGRLEAIHEGDNRAFFLNLPACDENGHSYFDYGGKIGLSDEFLARQREVMDEISFNSLYMGRPVEREGLLYEPESLRWYVELPPQAPDGVFAVCDTASGKGDDTVMLVFAQYGNDHYMIDCVCSDALPEITDELLTDCIVRNKVQMARFESNAAGGRTADEVSKKVKARNWECGITKEWTQANKETKIRSNSSWVKSRCLFRSLDDLPRNSEYAKTMRKAMTYSYRGKNKHDDVPDALAQYAIFSESQGVDVQPSIQIFDRRRLGF